LFFICLFFLFFRLINHDVPDEEINQLSEESNGYDDRDGIKTVMTLDEEIILAVQMASLAAVQQAQSMKSLIDTTKA
jgi:hypothetical protein